MDGTVTAQPASAELKDALLEAHIPTLVAALVQMTGDRRWMQEERPVYTPFGDDQGGLSPEFQARVRAAAAEAVAAAWSGASPPPPPNPAVQREMMDYIAGGPIPEAYAPFLMEELRLGGEDVGRPQWDAPALKAAAARMKVVVFGAGMSGLLAAIRLQQAGVDVEIIEKNAEVGGTWLENVYPGCRVDTPNHLYSYSFEPNHAWPYRYSTQDVLLAYFQNTADKHGLRPKIRFETRVLRTVFDEAAALWRTEVKGPDGQTSLIESHAVVSAVGQLNEPKLPDIPGLDRFKGRAFHSARWPADFDPRGLDVAVIGTGASAFQFVPEVAPLVKSLTVYQRTPPWLAPTADYHEAVGAGKRRLLEHVPFYDRWYRFYLFWTMTDGVYEAVKADPDWRGGRGAVGAANAMLGSLLIEMIKLQIEARTDLLPKVTPAYPFGAKRALRDNGVWIKALSRENVDLVDGPIAALTEEGVETIDGVLRRADAVIYGTGFHASAFLKDIEVIGRGGLSLHAVWNGDARAYLGICVPGFPNFFMLYGPNTNIVVNGSIIFFSECGVRYILGCLKLLAETGSSALEVRPEVHDAFNASIDAANAQMAWGASEVRSWYKNDTGRVSQNWPFPLVDYWRATLAPDPGDFQLTQAAEGLRSA